MAIESYQDFPLCMWNDDLYCFYIYIMCVAVIARIGWTSSTRLWAGLERVVQPRCSVQFRTTSFEIRKKLMRLATPGQREPDLLRTKVDSFYFKIQHCLVRRAKSARQRLL